MPSAIRNWRPSRPRLRPSKETAHYRSADWLARRLSVLVRDAYVCRDCSSVTSGKDAHVDHIIPLEDGGTDDLANLATRCSACHGRKTRAEQRSRGLL
jgi:5-methylcytosine-specific restriction endonuclease McrA